MKIETETEFKNAQKRLNNLQMVLVEAKKHASNENEYTKISKSLLWGIKNLEDDIYEFLSRF